MTLSLYTFVSKIGQGSYGEVWLVEDKIKKKCVLKKISFSNANEKEKTAARSECILLKQLVHPNIVQYRDSFEESGSLYIAMSYCEGGDLYSKLKERKGIYLSEKQITEWFIQIVMALSYMHERNILHRDLKTQNIFLAKSSVIKVGDLGIAKQLQNKNDMAVTLIGTPYYMSPELFSKQPYNFKSDIWSLGCITYEMATLKHAFNAKNYNALSYKIIMGQMPNMPSIYSKDLIGLIEAMLSNKPERRPSTNKILRDPYIQEHIKNFLEKAKCSKKSVSSPKHQAIIHKSSSDSSDGKPRTPGSSPYKNGLIKLPNKLVLSDYHVPHPSNSPDKEDDNNDVICQHVSNHKFKHSSEESKDSRRSSQTSLEKEIEKIDIAVELKEPSPTHIKHVSNSPLIKRKISKLDENDDGSRANERQSARCRRREKNRDQGLKTMLFTVDNDDHENKGDKSNSENSHNGNKKNARNRRCNSSESESIVNLPQLKKRTDDEYLTSTEEGARVELMQLVEKMNETLTVQYNQILMAAKDSLLCPVNCYDESSVGPAENCEETLGRTKLHEKRYPEIRKEIIKSIGWKKLAAGYDILRNMDLEHEMHLKDLLGEEDYERFAGKVIWLKMVEEGF